MSHWKGQCITFQLITLHVAKMEILAGMFSSGKTLNLPNISNVRKREDIETETNLSTFH